MENSAMQIALEAQKTANKAQFDISVHEARCSERYAGIKEQLNSIPILFKWVYIGIGMAITIPTVLEILHFFVK